MDGFFRGSYGARVLSCGLGLLCVGLVLLERRSPWWVWLGPALHGLAWPHLARWLRGRAPDQVSPERRALLVDHCAVGLWTAAMAFSLVPAILMLSLKAMDSMIAGGWRQFARGMAAHAGGVAAGALVYGVAWQPAPSVPVLWACALLLFAYLLLVGQRAYQAISGLQAQREELRRLSLHDALSGLHNRRHVDASIQTEYLRFQRGGDPAALAMIDFDHFKSINDELGHPVGDKVIRRFAARLKGSFRRSDVVGRYGGEEFVVLMPHTTAHDAGLFMKRLQAELRDKPILEGRAVTVSIGIAGLTPDLGNHEEWVHLADQMLYRAKEEGRNRVVIAGQQAFADTQLPARRKGAKGEPSLPPGMRLMVGLELGGIAAAIFDPSDRLAWANEVFRRLYGVLPKTRTFSDILYSGYRRKCGPRIETDDIRVWLSVADTLRRRQPQRSMSVEMYDGGRYRVEEISMANGWLLVLCVPQGEAPPAGAASATSAVSAGSAAGTADAAGAVPMPAFGPAAGWSAGSDRGAAAAGEKPGARV
ncbi:MULTISPECIES: diguanylate cyclase [Cupriavidus]